MTGRGRINVYLPPDLNAAMKAHPLDWSRIAQEAFRAAIEAERKRAQAEAAQARAMVAEYGPQR